MAFKLATDTIIEERSEIVVSSLNGETHLKACKFLKPCAVSINDQFLSVPPFTKPTSYLQAFPLKVEFKGREIPHKKWKSWVQSLHAKHHQTWEKAGIEKSILGSVYRIVEQNESILEIADRWCPKTNTFIFPWGETAITLEDMLVLGGFSVLGDSVLAAVDDEGLLSMNEALLESWRIVKKTSGDDGYCNHYLWIDYFMGSEIGIELEHAAFLVLWLSRFVFPRSYVGTDIFPVALRLSQGCMLALGPAVLASIYRELSLLKQHILSKNVDRRGNPTPDLCLLAPFELVQVWVWERFPILSPTPAGLIQSGDPRVARWDNIDKSRVKDIGLANAGRYFWLRPYAAALRNWQCPPEFYQMESFARCIRVSQLVGLDCVEEYNPHRVAMQFGFDQDIPCSISRTGRNFDDVWGNYNRPVNDMELNIPDRLKTPHVTQRYVNWWNEFVLNKKDEMEFSAPKKRQTPINFPGSRDVTVDEDKFTTAKFLQTLDKNKSVENGIKVDNINKTLENTEKNTQPEISRENGVDIDTTLKNTKKNTQLETSRENGDDINTTLENAEKNIQPELAGENGGHTELYSFKLEARIIQLERIFGKRKTVAWCKFGKGPGKT